MNEKRRCFHPSCLLVDLSYFLASLRCYMIDLLASSPLKQKLYKWPSVSRILILNICHGKEGPSCASWKVEGILGYARRNGIWLELGPFAKGRYLSGEEEKKSRRNTWFWVVFLDFFFIIIIIIIIIIMVVSLGCKPVCHRILVYSWCILVVI